MTDRSLWVLLDWSSGAPREVERFGRWSDADSEAQKIPGSTSIEDSRTWDRVKSQHQGAKHER
ncbi:hypothetical protein R088_24455 [Salmonella enterica subsp. enterica serovar Heidelberg]|nr:hypothetical protein [Salmonella enterica subsp. enterica serovar Heidelberg]EEK2418821.1 hypothetical protein [Salmonella enterica subsp. enterica serovar Heidelberg]EGC9888838.1 hypothetical protein [Salmonella enterica]